MNHAIRFGLLFIVSSSAFLEACSRPLKAQDSCNFVRNNEQQRVSWKGKLPIKISLHHSVPTEAYGAIDRAMAEYKDKVGHGQDVFQIVDRNVGGEVNPVQDGASVIYWFDTWDANKPNEQARTTIYWSGNQIFEADMRINAHNFHNFNYSDAATSNSDLDLDSLVLHELGHVLGLAHNVTIGSIMNITLDDGDDRRLIGAVDSTSLSCEY